MKNTPILLLSLLVPYLAISQTADKSALNIAGKAAENNIVWKTATIEDLPGIGKYPLLGFNGAQYDLATHLFPMYATRIAAPAMTVSGDVRIADAVFEPLNSIEQNALNSYDPKVKEFISGEIRPAVTVSLYKKNPYLYVQFIPIRRNKTTGGYEKLVAFSLQADPVTDLSRRSTAGPERMYAATSVLSSGKWYKVSVTAEGIYKMSFSFLKSLGMEMGSVLPANLRVYGNGGGQLPFANSEFRYDDLQENPIYVTDLNNNGKFDTTDYVLFYGQSAHRWKYSASDSAFHHSLNLYSDSAYYFITADLGPGKRIMAQSASALTPTHTVTSFNDYQLHELELSNLLKSGRQWLGETFDILTSYNFSFTFPNIETSSSVRAIADAAARRDPPGTDFYWQAGSASSSFNVIGVNTASIYTTFYRTFSDTVLFIPPSSGIIPVTITKTTPSPAIGWLNYIELNARRKLIMNGSQMPFRDVKSVGSANVAKFILSNASSSLQVWDVTNPFDIKVQQGNLSAGNFDFTLPVDSLREFMAFNGQTFPVPVKEGKVANQDLHGMAHNELIIVTHPLFLQQANALADLHRSQDKMKVAVATTEEVYNEFSSGAQDVSAIRDFVKMFYDRAVDSTQFPRYLLLFGRGSYNLKATVNNTNFVPAYESGTSNDPTISYPSDDFYGMLDSNEGKWDITPDVLDIGVGRLPVKTATEADVVLNKILKYSSVPGTIETGNSCSSNLCYGLGDWTNAVTLCADDEDGSLHQIQAEGLAQKIDAGYPQYNIEKIYLDAYQQVSTPGGERYPDATAEYNRRMDRGTLIVNYTGHGGELGWAHERFLEIHDIESWKNQCKLPLFFTATCEFSRWDDPSRTSAGELTFLNPNGGGIGLMSTTRVVYSQPNAVLNDFFYDFTFVPLSNGKMPRLGDLHMLTKNQMAPSSINHRNFSLLSDPALSLNYPEYSVATTEINGAPVNIAQPDTANALSQVTISGEIRDKNGNPVPGFNGIIYPTVYDKVANITTLSNDGSTSPAMNFKLQKNVLFKGKASVSGGKFTFSFIVPKDIAYNFGKGRISYYAHDGYEDASGYFEDFIIGGTNPAAPADGAGPDIKLYMNDEKFIFGGITNTDPKVYAVVSDSSGVNTAGTGIGHDITAVLDGNATKPLVLNDYYESDMNNYRKGSVRYPLSGLSEGQHTLSIKVWDVYNNSSSSYTEFVVAPSAELALKHVLNYPNPFTTKTSFYFEHNRCCVNMDVQVQVYTVSGKLVKTIQQRTNMEGYRSSPIEWDGTDDFGDKIGRGVYVYRLRVQSSSGEIAEQFEKLVILK